MESLKTRKTMSNCIEISSGFICMSAIDFIYPYCHKKYSDSDEKYLRKFNFNVSGYTKIKCSCGERFGMTYDIKGDAVGFKLK
jgi:hypothetical protein